MVPIDDATALTLHQLGSVLIFNELEARGLDELVALIPVVTVP